MIRLFLLLLPLSYFAGVGISLGFDWYEYWVAGAAGGFALVEALEFASYWPLRAYWHLV